MAGGVECFVLAFRDLCERGGSLELHQLTGTHIAEVIDSHPEHFVFANSRVFARTGLRVCPSYSAGKCRDDHCLKLHICRFFVAGACQYGNRCKSSHNLDESCTVANLNSPRYVLEKALSPKGLFSLLLLNDRLLLPEICSYYNSGDGDDGNCKFQRSCTKLHVCYHYILEDCIYSSNRCKRSHDLLTPNNKKTLEKRGFGGHRMPDLLGKLHNAAQMQDAMRKDVTTDSKDKKEKDGICLYYLRKNCQFKDKCKYVHFDLPYCWQWHEQQWKWKDIPNMEEIEKDFCDPACDSHNGAECIVDFLNMKLGGYSVRRLSTANSISKPCHFILTTQWCWYWKDENDHWVEYASEDVQSKATVDSEILEKSYHENSNGVVKFEAGSQKYILSFAEMVQQKETTKRKRDVRRRPQFVSAQKMDDILKRGRSCKHCGHIEDTEDTESAQSEPSITNGIEHENLSCI
uniref:protein mono-ADP-ribosyltransferase PARP12-like isoform X2 n=1 Tax=Myxine glutinosa TaxID=7769 RepID=UPI00358F1116